MGTSLTIPTSIRRFWGAFQATVDYDPALSFYDYFHFGDDERSANEFAALVLCGRKRATSALLWSHEYFKKPPPTVGALSVVTDGQNRPVCVIASTQIDVIAFDEVAESFAAAEGEGDRTLSYWRKVHWRFFGRECHRMNRAPDLQMPVVCEQFKVIYPARD